MAVDLAKELLNLANRLPDTSFRLLAHYGMDQSLFFLGDLVGARQHLAEGTSIYDPAQHHTLAFRYVTSPGVTCRSYGAWSLLLLGYSDQASNWNDQALSLARDIAQPFNIAFALTYAAAFHQRRQEARLAQERAQEAMWLASEQGFSHWVAHGRILHGWALTALGQQRHGVEEMRQGLHAYGATGAQVQLPYYLGLLAEACARIGQVEEGLTLLAEAYATVETNGASWYVAELHRLNGELLLLGADPKQAEAEICLQNARSIAQRQSAKLWELRAALSLARLWQQQGRQNQARHLVADVYGWFTEGFDTADLQEANDFLRRLS